MDFDVFKVHTVLLEEINEGRVWLRYSASNKNERSLIERKRSLVRITYKDNMKSVYCEALHADDFYWDYWFEHYKDQNVPRRRRLEDDKKDTDSNVIFIGGWYRDLLGIGNKHSVELNVKPVKNLWSLFFVYLYGYPFQHPQNLVRLTAMVGIISLGLGLIGVGLGVTALQPQGGVINGILLSLGLLVTLSGPVGIWITRR